MLVDPSGTFIITQRCESSATFPVNKSSVVFCAWAKPSDGATLFTGPTVEHEHAGQPCAFAVLAHLGADADAFQGW